MIADKSGISEEKLLPRVRLGPKAYEIAETVAGGEKVTAVHLEAAILNLIESKESSEKDPEWLKKQLQLMNETLLSMRFMIQALSADTAEEVEIMLEKMNTSINKKQIKGAKDAGLDHPALKKIQDRIQETQKMRYIDEQQSRQDQELERD